MRFRATLRALIGVIGLTAACAEGASMPSQVPVPTVATRNEPVNLTRSYRHSDLVELHTAYIQEPGAAGDSRSFLGLKMQSKLGVHLPMLQAEIDYGSFNPQSSLALDNDDHRSIWLAAHSAWRGIQYGASYQSVGQSFAALAPVSVTAAPGTDRFDVWGQHRFGKLGVRTFASHAREQAGNRTVDTTIGTALNYVLGSAPHVGATLTYSRQLVERSADAALDGALNHNLSGSLSIRRPRWNATASTSYTYQADCTASDADTAGIWTETIAATYVPHPNFSLAPSLTYQDAPQPGSSSRTKTRSAAVTLNFKPANGSFLFTASGSMAAQSNPSWTADGTNFTTQASISMPLPLGDPERSRGSLALQVGYTEASDAYASSENFMLNLEVSLHAFN